VKFNKKKKEEKKERIEKWKIRKKKCSLEGIEELKKGEKQTRKKFIGKPKNK